MKKIILAADDRSDSYLDAMDQMKADFDYAVEGIEKLARDSKEGERKAIGLMADVTSYVNKAISEISNSIENE